MLTDHFVRFGETNLHHWRRVNRACWSIKYWEKAIHDDQHYGVWQTIDRQYRNNQISLRRGLRDYKMLYDSFLWKTILLKMGYSDYTKCILELLPGKSATIPVALCSLGFRGVLDRIDLEPEVLLPYKYLEYNVNWVRQNIFSDLQLNAPYDFIVGNHVIDDLIFYCLARSQRHDGYQMLLDRNYIDPDKSTIIWQKCADSGEMQRIIHLICSIFLLILRSMHSGATLMLREYPAAFALQHGNLTHINAHLYAFHELSTNIAKVYNGNIRHLDLETISVPKGSRYPHSVLVITKS